MLIASKVIPYAVPILIMALMIAGLVPIRDLYFTTSTIAIAHMAFIVFIAIRWGLGPSLITAMMGAFTVPYFFMEPYYSLKVVGAEDVELFLTFLVTAFGVGSLSGKTKHYADLNEARLKEIEGLYTDLQAENVERKRAEEALLKREQEYLQLNETLEQRIAEAATDLRNKDRMLILQGRQAVMGEMISNIAHQWRQPLNILGLLVQEVQATYKMGLLSAEYLNANVKKTMEVIQYMSKTIDYFRNFFRPEKEKVQFSVLTVVEKSVSLLEGSTAAHGIRTEIKPAGDPSINGYPNEFAQVLLNIVNNARDALLARKVDSPTIIIRLWSEGDKTIVTISDNAGGIPEGIIDKVFDPYFTTKGPEQGTGLGLYMSKTIIEKHMNGTLSACNVGDGVEFRIEVRSDP